jgi:putative flippase GtrA
MSKAPSRLVPRARNAWHRLGRFAIVGSFNSGLYAVVTWWLIAYGHVAPGPASLLGYLIAIPVAYFGHRWVTFTSAGAVPVEAVRFVTVHAMGLLVAWEAMDLTANRLGLHFAFGIIAAVVLVPLLSFLVLDHFVFNTNR